MKFRKISKKAISLIVAVVMILSCATVSFSTFAEETQFKVTPDSPAVPLYVGKAIRTGDLFVKMGLRSKAGNLLRWTRKSGTSAYYDEGGYLVGGGVGVTEFSVFDGTNTQTVWVIVNAQGDTDFNLVDLDFSAGVKKSDWLEGTADSASTIGKNPSSRYTHQPASGDLHKDETGYMTGRFVKLSGVVSSKTVSVAGEGTKTALYIPAAANHGGVKAAIYKCPMLDDFSNYTIEANMSNQMTTSDPENLTAAPGLFARTTANYDAKDGEYILTSDKSITMRFRNYGGLSFFAVSTADRIDEAQPWENIPFYSKATNTYYTVGSKSDYFMCTDKSKVFYPDAKDASSLTNKNVKISFNGIAVKYVLNGNTIFDPAANEKNHYNAFSMRLGSATSTVADTSLAEREITSTPDYETMYNQNIKAQKGTIGIINNYGNDLYVYDLKVTPQNILDQKDAFPEMLTVTGDYTMEVNTRVALKNIGIAAADTVNDNYEIVNGVLQVFSVPAENDGKITIGAATIKIVPQGSESTINSTKFADSQMVVKPSNQRNSYKITIANDEVIPGTLKVTENESQLIYGLEEVTGKTSLVLVCDPTSFVLSAEYTTNSENLNNLAVLGASIRLPDDANKAEAIRFLTRVPAIRNSKLYSDENITYKAVGTLLMPKALLGSNKLQFPSASTDPTSVSSVTIGGKSAKNVVFETLSQSTSKFSDAWTTMYYGEFDELDVLKEDMVAVSYVWYKKSSGATGFSYSDQVVKSYDEIYDAAFPINNNDTNLDEVIRQKCMYTSAGGTNFNARISGAYTISGQIKDSSDNIKVIGGGLIQNSLLSAATADIESGLYYEGTLYSTITGKPVLYNYGEVAKFVIDSNDIPNIPDAPGGTAANPIIVDDNPIPPELPEDEPEYGEHTEWNFDNTYYKLTKEKSLSIAYIGGSVTWGAGTDKDCWRTQTADWFKQQYPQATITPYDCSMSGSSSVWGSPRYDNEVVSKNPDFVFIECSINDLYIGTATGGTKLPKKEESAILMDSMIRRTQKALPNTDIVLITVVDYSTVIKGNVNADAHQMIANYEKVFWLDMTECTLAAVGADRAKWYDYYQDDVHPNADGHRVYSSYITSELSKKLSESAARNPDRLVAHTVAPKPYDESVPTSFDIVYCQDLNYSDAWTKVNLQYDYNTKVRKFRNDFNVIRASQGATLTYSFKGTTLIMLGEFNKGANIVVTLDGYNTKSIAYDGLLWEVFLYSKLDPSVTHTVKVTVNGTGKCDFSAFAVGKVD